MKDDFGSYVADAITSLRLTTDTRVLGVEMTQDSPGSIDVHVTLDSGATSWASFPTGLERTSEVSRALEGSVRLLFIGELARRGRLH